MNTPVKLLCIIILAIAATSFVAFKDSSLVKPKLKFPYKQAGLTERQAAAHLLSRFTYGARPGDLEAVMKMGLEKWFLQQLDANLADDTLNQLLSNYDALRLTNIEILNSFPRRAQIIKMAVKDGVVDKDSVKEDRQAFKDILKTYMEQKGFRPEQELFRQFINQKILRAAYSNNQLQEMMTDFWFNHFNVSITKNDCAEFIPVYERDAIRPNALGKFENLLLATARSPAMLLYLDNFSSAGPNDNDTRENIQRRNQFLKQQLGDSAMQKIQKAKKTQGLNENYAREVMELHTLGVDGGYTQQDVTNAARVLTGWTIYPMGDDGYSNAIKKLLEKVGEDKLIARGFVHKGDFLFAPNRHDQGEKIVLGRHFPAGGGYGEGVELLTMLAHHPSTAHFIAKKIAVRFVSDNPPASLVDKMASTFREKEGDIKQVLLTMVTSPEFWNASTIHAKTKSPFELAISAVRSMKGDIKQPYQLYDWITKMGQKIYYYQAPTGFPDNGQYWINTGALLERMNFGLALAAQRIPGIKVDTTLLVADNNKPQPAGVMLGSPEFQRK